jgi:hypothetical protein
MLSTKNEVITVIIDIQRKEGFAVAGDYGEILIRLSHSNFRCHILKDTMTKENGVCVQRKMTTILGKLESHPKN